MHVVPATFAGNETAMMAVGSLHCSEWWPVARDVLGKSLPKMLYASAFFVRCGHSVVDDTVVTPNDVADAAAAAEAVAFIEKKLGARAYAVIEWSSAVNNVTRFANSVEALRQNWSGVALLLTNSTRGALDAAEAANSGDASYDTMVVIDMTGTLDDELSSIPVYSRESLITDMAQADAPDSARKSIREVRQMFSDIRKMGIYRVCMVIDVIKTSREVFETYSGFAAQFRGANDYPWLGLAPPRQKNNASKWRREVGEWRSALRQKLSFDDSSYASPHSLFGPQVMIHDRFLSDRGRWTVDRFLEDLESRYGGVDSVLLWHSYPNIGVDDRNQFDMLEDVQDLRDCVKEFHDRGVKVLLPYNPWNDIHNRSVETMLDLIRRLGADGINGDTMYGMAWNAASRTTLLEPECGADQRIVSARESEEEDGDPYHSDDGLLGSLNFDQTTWNYYSLVEAGVYATGKAVKSPDEILGDPETGFLDLSKPYKTVIPGLFYGPPLASRYKMLDTRHNPVVCDRWSTNRLNGFHHSFFNAGGYATWENVWGIWNGLSDRDAQIVRQISHLQRFLSEILFSDAVFEPYLEGLPPGVYASTVRNETATIYLVVNRRGSGCPGVYEDPATALPDDRISTALFSNAGIAGAFLFDLWNGRRVVDQDLVKIEHGGFGAIGIFARGEVSEEYLAQRRELTQQPLASYDAEPKLLNQTMVSYSSSFARNVSSIANTTLIPGGSYHFEVHGIQVEGYGGLQGPSEDQQPDVQFDWETLGPRRFHSHDMLIDSFRIDTFPVTNALYLKFLNSSGYRPTNTKNFLKHLQGSGMNAGNEEEPVRWVSLDDAREFCAFNGKRIPHSWEWSRVATGPSQNSSTRAIYPWGNAWDDEAVPRRDSGDRMLPPPKVGTHPKGQSPEGVHDLVGTIWQWSDEFCDQHTCRAIIRGGSTYRPRGSPWYLHQAYRNDEQNTLLLFSDGLDRSGAVGFRCVVDSG